MLVLSTTNRRRRLVMRAAELQADVAIMRGSGFVGVEPVYTTWNPADKSANITLSNFNLTATGTNAFTGAVRAVQGKLAGKSYFEFLVGQTSNLGTGMGVASGDAVLADIGVDNLNALFWRSDGSVFFNGDFVFNLGALEGSHGAVAYDGDAGLVWIKSEFSFWNDDEFADPATGDGGLDVFDIIGPGGIFPMFSSGGNGDNVTANFGVFPESNFFFEPPDGYTGWEEEPS